MELRHLRYFVAVAEELHFTRAAARLGISQPPLTQQIKALEEEIGAPLFVRKPRAIMLTDAGRVLLAEARTILADLADATVKARDAAKGVVGHLALGFTEAATFNPLIIRMLERYRQSYPGIEMHLEENFSPALIDSLRENRLQVALARPQHSLPDEIAFVELLKEERVVAVPTSHPLAGRTEVELGALEGESFVTYPRVMPPGFAGPLGTPFSPRISQRAPRISSTINLVAAGLGISVAPESVKNMRSDGVAYLRLVGPLPPATLGLAYRRDDASLAVRNFIDMAVAAVAPGRVPPDTGETGT